MERTTSKTKLLDAAIQVIRRKGYTATRVEDICDAAKVTKGSFFHHFKTKEELAVTAADYWTEWTSELFAGAAFRTRPDPRERVLGYIEFRKEILEGRSIAELSCFIGTMLQEIYDESPAIRAACDRSISAHVAHLGAELAAAKAIYAPDAEWDPASVALHTQAVLQGAFVLSKAKLSSAVVADSIDHLHRYVSSLLPLPPRKKRR
jgi:TetR/AcrR family transcriptional repressor of nem operon